MTLALAARLGAAAVIAAVWTSTIAHGQPPWTLGVAAAVATFGTEPRTGAHRDSLAVFARFTPTSAVEDFAPAADALGVTLSDVALVAAAPPIPAKSFRAWSRRGRVTRWRYRERGPAGTVGLRQLDANARTGALRLTVRRADLDAVRAAGPGDTTLSVALGEATASAPLTFRVSRGARPTIWKYRNVPAQPGPLTWSSVAAGSLAGLPRPESEVARDAAQFAAIWTALGSPGPLPQVDFATEMVVVVSALVVGPGPTPPGLDVVAVRDTGGGVAVDWRLALCEEPNQCPGAPVPVECPTATPYHVLRVAQRPGGVTLSQVDTVWVCP